MTEPSAPVVPCAAANWLYGIGVAKTVAPCTGRVSHAWITTRIRIVFVERVKAGASDALAICSRSGGASAVTGIVPVAVGHPLEGTTAVAADVAEALPLAFLAVTVTRSVWPTSPLVTV
jgi:hypothetical protein